MNPYLEDFPIFSQKQADGKRLVYLDNAATTQKPLSVIRAMEEYYRTSNANPYRGLYQLSVKSTDLYEEARRAVREFLGAEKDCEVIFTRNSTESLNLVAYSYGMNFLKEGDEIALPVSEHHSNLVPWQIVAKAKGAKLIYLYPNESGRLTDEEIEKKITPKTRLVAAAQVSNVLGSVNPIEKIVKRAHEMGAVGLEAAIRYLRKVGYETIRKTEDELLAYTIAGMKSIPHITVYGDTENLKNRCGVISFNVDGVHPHDVSTILDTDGIAIRAGHHCAQPLMRFLKVSSTCRASLYFYNTKEDIDCFLESLKKVRGWLGLGN